MITEGLFVLKKRVIGEIHEPSYTLSLLAAGGNVDVYIYDIRVDKPGNFCPGEKPNLMEFFYVLEGTVVLKLDEGDVELVQGEHFHVYNLKEIINFTTANGAKLLCVSSQPTFNYLTEYYEGLCSLLENVESKDMYTYHHGNRVQLYSLKIAEKLAYTQQDIYMLTVASLFHDIGKYYVPDTILKKPDKLTSDEYECIKKHPVDSVKLLKDKFEERILLAVQQHHERLDGSGYPDGLKGDQIIPEARIIAVADAYDAMTSDRAYRKALSQEIALGELDRYADIQYDRVMVRALRAALEEEGANY